MPIKLAAAQNMPWDVDIVPVVSRNVEYLIPPVGTLSSVAAYNMPMLEWLHLPAQWLTGNVWWTILLTMLTFNLLSTTALYALGRSMFNERVGLVAAVLFTFSGTSISSSYTAWAQLLLPGFFAMVMLSLWLWYKQENGFWLASAGVLATAAFMSHFSALLLYPAMLFFAIVTRAKWQIRWLMAGIGAGIVMLAPYMLFQLDRDFIDLKAFLSREVLVSDEAMAEYGIYNPAYNNIVNSAETPAPQTTHPDNQVPTPQVAPEEQATFAFSRFGYYVSRVSNMYWRTMTYAYEIRSPNLERTYPDFASLFRTFLKRQNTLFLIAVWAAIFGYLRHFPKDKSLANSQSGRVLILVGFLTVMIALMMLTRTIWNASYWTGLISLEFLIASYAVSLLPNTRKMTILVVAILLIYVGIQHGERILRLMQHDDSQFTAHNVSIYRHVEAAVDYIAVDWDGDETLTVSYDILQDIRNLWWTPVWSSVDSSYRMGMNFDFLLSYHHGLENTNTNPIGTIENADYIIIYSPTLEDYNLADYTLAQFGTIYVLKPIAD